MLLLLLLYLLRLGLLLLLLLLLLFLLLLSLQVKGPGGEIRHPGLNAQGQAQVVELAALPWHLSPMLQQ